MGQRVVDKSAAAALDRAVHTAITHPKAKERDEVADHRTPPDTLAGLFEIKAECFVFERCRKNVKSVVFECLFPLGPALVPMTGPPRPATARAPGVTRDDPLPGREKPGGPHPGEATREEATRGVVQQRDWHLNVRGPEVPTDWPRDSWKHQV